MGGGESADEKGGPPISRRNMEKRIAREGMCGDLAVLLLAGFAAALCTVHSLCPKV